MVDRERLSSRLDALESYLAELRAFRAVRLILDVNGYFQ